MEIPSPPSTQRLLFLDVVRAYACVMMVFGHTVNDLIYRSARSTDIFLNWQHFRGLTAPTFLFVSGFAFYVATTRHWADYLRCSGRLVKRLRRVVILLIIGYSLHLPFVNPVHLFTTPISPDLWNLWMNVDILQCVAVNLLILHLAILVLRTPRRFLMYVGITLPAVFFLSPLVWYWNGQTAHPTFWNFYFGGNFQSNFPLVPWIAFHYAGILAAHWYKTRLETRPDWYQRFIGLGLATGLFGLVVYLPYYHLPESFKFSTLQAQSLWLRLAAVILIFAVISTLVRRLHSVPRVVKIVGAETLTIYWMHLVIIYGSAWNFGLVNHFGGSLSLLECVGVFIPMFLFLTGVVLLKNWLLDWYDAVRARWRAVPAGPAPDRG